MTQKVYFIYDDLRKPEKKLSEIIGNSKFSEIIYKGKSLKLDTLEKIENIENNFFQSVFLHLKTIEDVNNLKAELANQAFDTKIIHLFSNCVITSFEKFNLLIGKLLSADSNKSINDGMLLFFTNVHDYIRYLSQENLDASEMQSMTNTCFYDISNYQNLVSYLSKSFNTRCFNSISNENDTVIKKSTDKIKMKKEHDFYYLIPEDMVGWFVKPYNYAENLDKSSYSMQHYKIPDMSTRWVHKAFSPEEFDIFLKKAFQFIHQRKKRTATVEEVRSIKNDLYIKKIQTRINELKDHEAFNIIDSYIKETTTYKDIDEIIDYYQNVYQKITESYTYNDFLTIGHGDFCLSNILYDKDSEIFLLIDPKGALDEINLWTDEYYDIAKLSHSICGAYDFFNNNLYHIQIQQDKNPKLTIDFEDITYKEIFKRYLKENGFEYELVRLYEASLFLSMLPLHMDNPSKVFGFIINGINILSELEQNITTKAGSK